VNSGRDVRCLFIGADGGEKEKIARLIKEKGLNEQITIAEQVKGEADFIRMGYDRSRVLFMPSLYEGFGMPILEAYSRGCRIVCSRIEPFIELDINGVRFFDPVSVDDMSYALSCALDDVQPIVGECINKYRWSVIAAKLINDVDVA